MLYGSPPCGNHTEIPWKLCGGSLGDRCELFGVYAHIPWEFHVSFAVALRDLYKGPVEILWGFNWDSIP